MFQYVKNLTIEIIADITQIPHDVTEECISHFDFGETKIEGHYGHSCWWLPLGIVGLKIWNKNIAVSAEHLLYERVKAWEELNDRAKYCKAYLPKVYMPLIVKHTGTYERGGTVRHDGVNQLKEYPAFMMLNYSRPRSVEDKKMEEIHKAFIKDGIDLHYDTFRREQLGIWGDIMVVLDLHSTKGEVYL
jgi:hypothetical protein